MTEAVHQLGREAEIEDGELAIDATIQQILESSVQDLAAYNDVKALRARRRNLTKQVRTFARFLQWLSVLKTHPER